MRVGRGQKETPCYCVFRAVFRACYNRFRVLAARGVNAGTVSLEFCRGHEGRRFYGRKAEEYLADFTLVSRRHLEGLDYDVFRFHFLLGASWKLCCRRLNMDRGNFFHAVYRVEEKLGRAFAELQPYSLYPLDEYFGGAYRRNPAMIHRRTSGPRTELALSA